MEFVANTLGQKYLDFPGFNLKEAFTDASKFTPMLLILSSGADPSNNFQQLASDCDVDSSNFKIISLGQGQGEKAKETIKIAQLNGEWVCLQNCHLAVKWLPELELILESTSEDCHEDYRLFLTTMPTSQFPVTFLHQSIKLTNEPPKGIRANLKRIYSEVDDYWYSELGKPETMKPLLFCLTMFHTITLERRKYGSMGWNIPYQWMNSDFITSQQQLEIYVQENKDVPFETIQFLLGIINYGGRITDYNDEKLIQSLLKEFMNSECLIDNYKFMKDSPKNSAYKIPNTQTIDSVNEYINTLPFNDEPEIFGLHNNAKINFNLQTSKFMEEFLLSFEPTNQSGGSGNVNSEVLKLVRKLQEILPDNISIPQEEVKDSLLIFRNQEALRFNSLLDIIKESLTQLELSIQGFSVMSEQIEKMFNSFVLQKVPELWTEHGFLSMKKLVSWFDDLIERVDFFKQWMTNANIPLYLIGSFFFPQGFVTSVLQKYSRKNEFPIDALSLKTIVTQEFDLKEGQEGPRDGVYIKGLLLENACYDMKLKHLVESRPKVIHQTLPIIWLLPVENPVGDKNLFQCPMYKTPLKQGELSTTGHSTNFVMYLEFPMSEKATSDLWLRRGTALLLQKEF